MKWETWITRQEQAMVSDLEKTIVDAVSKPQLCGGIAVVVKAIQRGMEIVREAKLTY